VISSAYTINNIVFVMDIYLFIHLFKVYCDVGTKFVRFYELNVSEVDRNIFVCDIGKIQDVNV
jgi:hypothetical protein